MSSDDQREREVQNLIRLLQEKQEPGKITLSMGVVSGMVVMLFGAKVEFLRFTPSQTGAVSSSLNHFSERALKESSDPVKLVPVTWSFKVSDGMVQLDFPSAIDHLRLSPSQAFGLAANLMRFGRAAERQSASHQN